MELADFVVVMSMGRIEQIGTPKEVRIRPASRFVAEFVAAWETVADVRHHRRGPLSRASGDRPVRALEGSARLTEVTIRLRPKRLIV